MINFSFNPHPMTCLFILEGEGGGGERERERNIDINVIEKHRLVVIAALADKYIFPLAISQPLLHTTLLLAKKEP